MRTDTRGYLPGIAAVGLLLAVAAASAVPVVLSGSSAGPASGPIVPLPWRSTVATPLGSGPPTPFDTGQVSVVFPSALPRVQLLQDTNRSQGASMDVVQVLELAPASGGWTAVAAAFPLTLAGFNNSIPSATSSSGPTVGFSAVVGVFPVNGSIFSPGAKLEVAGLSRASATLRINYSVSSTGPTTAPGAGVSVAWSVSNWPLAGADDSVAVELEVANAPSDAFGLCTPLGSAEAGTHAASSGPQCSSHLALGTPTWSGSIAGVWAPGANGSVTELLLGSSTSSGAILGAYAPTNGTVELLVAAPHGTAVPGGAMTFGLSTALASVGSALHGDWPAFLGTSLAAAALAGVAIATYRWRDRRLRTRL
ncbi:MAG TPA: hypothetical protein VFF67_02915 [Thermoplasmata archaeon]|nr:hypothetical protein [Thermoplasmata archaeon]